MFSLVHAPRFHNFMHVCTALARSKAVLDPRHARKLGHVSIGLSVAGIIFSVIIVISAVTAVPGITASHSPQPCSYYLYLRTCYRYKTYVGSSEFCPEVKSPDGYCYYNNCEYQYSEHCYKYKTYVGSTGSCAGGFISSDGYCYSTSCLLSLIHI